jgi:hypothetical protein
LSAIRARFSTPFVAATAVVLAAAANALALPGFTTGPKTAAARGDAALLFDAAAACHGTFDRFVIRARFATPGYNVRYVRRIVADPSGRPIPLLGAKRIHVAFDLAGGHDIHGTNLVASSLTPMCPNLVQVKEAGDFEGTLSFGLGLRRTAGFRVFRLTNPTRVVIDIAH